MTACCATTTRTACWSARGRPARSAPSHRRPWSSHLLTSPSRSPSPTVWVDIPPASCEQVVVESLARVAGLLHDERPSARRSRAATRRSSTRRRSTLRAPRWVRRSPASWSPRPRPRVQRGRQPGVRRLRSGLDRVSQDDSPPLPRARPTPRSSPRPSAAARTFSRSTHTSPATHSTRASLPRVHGRPHGRRRRRCHRRRACRAHRRGSGLPALEGRDGQGRPRQHHPRPRRVRLPRLTLTRAFPAFNRALPALIRAFRRRGSASRRPGG